MEGHKSVDHQRIVELSAFLQTITKFQFELFWMAKLLMERGPSAVFKAMETRQELSDTQKRELSKLCSNPTVVSMLVGSEGSLNKILKEGGISFINTDKFKEWALSYEQTLASSIQHLYTGEQWGLLAEFIYDNHSFRNWKEQRLSLAQNNRRSPDNMGSDHQSQDEEQMHFRRPRAQDTLEQKIQSDEELSEQFDQHDYNEQHLQNCKQHYPNEPETHLMEAIKSQKEGTPVDKKLIRSKVEESRQFTYQMEKIFKRYNNLYIFRTLLIWIRVLDIHSIKSISDSILRKTSSIKGKVVVMLHGETGVGKSTIIGSAVGLQYEIVQNFGEKSLRPLGIIAQEHESLVSGYSKSPTRSTTKSFNSYKVKFRWSAKIDGQMVQFEVQFMDSPGFNDTRGHQIQLINNRCKKLLIQQPRAIVHLYIINRKWLGSKYDKLKQLVEIIAKSHKFTTYGELQKMVVFCFNCFKQKEHVKSLSKSIRDFIKQESKNNPVQSKLIIVYKYIEAELEKPYLFDIRNFSVEELMKHLLKHGLTSESKNIQDSLTESSAQKLLEFGKQLLIDLKDRRNKHQISGIFYVFLQIKAMHDVIHQKTQEFYREAKTEIITYINEHYQTLTGYLDKIEQDKQWLDGQEKLQHCLKVMAQILSFSDQIADLNTNFLALIEIKTRSMTSSLIKSLEEGRKLTSLQKIVLNHYGRSQYQSFITQFKEKIHTNMKTTLYSLENLHNTQQLSIQMNEVKAQLSFLISLEKSQQKLEEQFFNYLQKIIETKFQQNCVRSLAKIQSIDLQKIEIYKNSEDLKGLQVLAVEFNKDYQSLKKLSLVEQIESAFSLKSKVGDVKNDLMMFMNALNSKLDITIYQKRSFIYKNVTKTISSSINELSGQEIILNNKESEMVQNFEDIEREINVVIDQINNYKRDSFKELQNMVNSIKSIHFYLCGQEYNTTRINSSIISFLQKIDRVFLEKDKSFLLQKRFSIFQLFSIRFLPKIKEEIINKKLQDKFQDFVLSPFLDLVADLNEILKEETFFSEKFVKKFIRKLIVAVEHKSAFIDQQVYKNKIQRQGSEMKQKLPKVFDIMKTELKNLLSSDQSISEKKLESIIAKLKWVKIFLENLRENQITLEIDIKYSINALELHQLYFELGEFCCQKFKILIQMQPVDYQNCQRIQQNFNRLKRTFDLTISEGDIEKVMNSKINYQAVYQQTADKINSRMEEYKIFFGKQKILIRNRKLTRQFIEVSKQTNLKSRNSCRQAVQTLVVEDENICNRLASNRRNEKNDDETLDYLFERKGNQSILDNSALANSELVASYKQNPCFIRLRDIKQKLLLEDDGECDKITELINQFDLVKASERLKDFKIWVQQFKLVSSNQKLITLQTIYKQSKATKKEFLQKPYIDEKSNIFKNIYKNSSSSEKKILQQWFRRDIQKKIEKIYYGEISVSHVRRMIQRNQQNFHQKLTIQLNSLNQLQLNQNTDLAFQIENLFEQPFKNLTKIIKIQLSLINDASKIELKIKIQNLLKKWAQNSQEEIKSCKNISSLIDYLTKNIWNIPQIQNIPLSTQKNLDSIILIALNLLRQFSTKSIDSLKKIKTSHHQKYLDECNQLVLCVSNITVHLASTYPKSAFLEFYTSIKKSLQDLKHEIFLKDENLTFQSTFNKLKTNRHEAFEDMHELINMNIFYDLTLDLLGNQQMRNNFEWIESFLRVKYEEFETKFTRFDFQERTKQLNLKVLSNLSQDFLLFENINSFFKRNYFSDRVISFDTKSLLNDYQSKVKKIYEQAIVEFDRGLQEWDHDSSNLKEFIRKLEIFQQEPVYAAISEENQMTEESQSIFQYRQSSFNPYTELNQYIKSKESSITTKFLKDSGKFNQMHKDISLHFDKLLFENTKAQQKKMQLILMDLQKIQKENKANSEQLPEDQREKYYNSLNNTLLTTHEEQKEKFIKSYQQINHSLELQKKSTINNLFKQFAEGIFVIQKLSEMIPSAQQILQDIIKICLKDACQNNSLICKQICQFITKNYGKSIFGSKILAEQSIFAENQNRLYHQKAKDMDFDSFAKQMKEIVKYKSQILGIQKSYHMIIQSLQKLSDSDRKNKLDELKRTAKQCSTRKEQRIICILVLMSMSQSNLEMKPISINFKAELGQIIAIYLSLQQKTNKYLEVQTGQGKSLVIAVLAAYLALDGYEVYCTCYSDYLTNRDNCSWMSFFKSLNIDDKITYKTLHQICEQAIYIDNQQIDFEKIIRENILKPRNSNVFKSIAQGIDNYALKPGKKIMKDLNIWSSKKKTAIIFDEVDVAHAKQFAGQIYRPSIFMTSQSIKNLLRLIYQKVKSNSEKDVKKYILSSQEWKLCMKEYGHLAILLQNQVDGMIMAVQDDQSISHTYKNNEIAYIDNDGINENIKYGYATVVSYIAQFQKKNPAISESAYSKNIGFHLTLCELSYRQVLMKFDLRIGLTGSLSTSKERYQQDNINQCYRLPSIFGKNKRKHTVIITKDHYKAIVDKCNKLDQRPVIVLFKNLQEMLRFQNSEQAKALRNRPVVLNEQLDHKSRDFVIERAFRRGIITLMTSAFSRGTDFKCYDNEVEALGGAAIVLTFIPSSKSEYVQTKGRVARKGASGQIIPILSSQEVQLKQNAQQLHQLNNILESNSDEFQKVNEDIWSKDYNEETKIIKTRVKEAETKHAQTMKFFRNQNWVEILKKIEFLNKVTVKQLKNIQIIIAIDATESMRNSFIYIKKIITDAIEAATLIIINRNKSKYFSFRIQIVLYRNYNSRDLILEKSDLTDNPVILCKFLQDKQISGGWGHEAIEVVLQYANTISKEFILLIGDSGPHSNKQIIKKRNQICDEQTWKKLGYPKTTLDLQLKQLKVPIHCFYLADKKEFVELSDRTNGTAKKFTNSSQTQQDLTDFLVENILKPGGDDLVEGYRQYRSYSISSKKR